MTNISRQPKLKHLL